MIHTEIMKKYLKNITIKLEMNIFKTLCVMDISFKKITFVYVQKVAYFIFVM